MPHSAPRRKPLTPRLFQLAVGSCLLLGSSTLLEAQGGQRYGFQVALFSTAVSLGDEGGNTAGNGFESQLRANTLFSTDKFALSLGAGLQYTKHSAGSDHLSIAGVFLEPRWVPATPFTRVFPYISARLALLRQSSNFGSASTGRGIGAGGGIAFKLTRTVNLDAGVALIRQQFGKFDFNAANGSGTGEFQPFTTYAAKVGLSWGFPNR